MTFQVEKSCHKLTNFWSAINRNRFQVSPQFSSSRSSYDVILVTFHEVSQSKHSKAIRILLFYKQAESPSQDYFFVLMPKRNKQTPESAENSYATRRKK